MKTNKGILLTLAIFLVVVLFVVVRTITAPKIDLSNYTKICESQHFIVYSDSAKEDGNYYSRSLETIYRYINDNYFPIRNKNKLKVILLFNKVNEVSNNTEILKPINEGPLYGYYSDGEAVIDMNLGMGTVGHEVAHYFTSAYKTDLSMFDSEGIATYFEKFAGYINENGDSKISFGYLHPRRIINANNKINSMTLADVINSPNHGDNDMSYSVMVFLQRKGLLKDYMMQCLTTDKSDKQIIETLFGEPLTKVDIEWRSWLISQANTPDLKLVQISFMCKSAEEFNTWIRENGLIWDEKTEMYKMNK